MRLAKTLFFGLVLMAIVTAAPAVDLRWPLRNDGCYGPSAKQLQFLNSAAREQLGGGAKRGGKGVIGSAKAIMLSVVFPGNRGMIGRQAFTDLRDSTLVTFFELCPPELIILHNKSEHRIVIRSTDPEHPSEIIYRGLGEDSASTARSRSKERAKSVELGWFWIDEASECSFDAYRQLLAQLCWRLPEGRRPPYMAMLTSNPEPGWVKNRFADDQSEDYIVGKADAEFIQFLPRDNPGLPPNWEADLRATMDEEWVKRYLEGSWEIHEGQVFTELNERIHNLDNYFDTSDPDKWARFHSGFRLIGCLDHASTGITAYALTGFDSDENCFALQEHYKENQRISEHAAAIWDLEEAYRHPEYRLIDPSTESDTLQSGKEMYSVQAAYSDPRFGHVEAGREIRTIAAHRANIRVGIDLIKEYLHVNPLHVNPFTQTLGSPRIFISRRRNPNGWRELVGLKKELRSDGTIEFAGSDHWLDDVRYTLMSRPSAAEKKKLDVARLPTIEQVRLRTHEKWAKGFGKAKNEESWF